MMKTGAIFMRAVGDLKDRLGIGLSDLEPGEIVALVDACRKVASPFDEVNADAAGMPVRVNASVWFWPLTVGAVVWLEETADKWWADDPKRYRNALVHAAVHSRERGAFASVDRHTCDRAIRETLRTVTATSAEIDKALDRVLGMTSSAASASDTASTATSWAELVAKTEAATGVPREQWLWGVSFRETLRAYHESRQLALAHGGAKAERMLDELDEAVNALQRLKVNIMKRVKEIHG